MPAVMQLGNLQYVLIALIGGLMAIGGVGGVTVGMIVAFADLSESFLYAYIADWSADKYGRDGSCRSEENF